MIELYTRFDKFNILRDIILNGDVLGAKKMIDADKICVDIPVRDDEKNIFMTLLGLIALRPALKSGILLMEMLIDVKASIN